MKVRTTQDSSNIGLESDEYEQLLNAAPHERARLAIRLMAHSLRAETVAQDVFLHNFETIDTRHLISIHVLTVPSKCARGKNHRDVFISESLVRDIKRYLGRDHLDSPELLFDENEESIRQWLETAGANAAEATGKDGFGSVTPIDLRRYCATNFIFRFDIKPAIVAQICDWPSVEAMNESLIVPSDVVAKEAGDCLLGTGLDQATPRDETDHQKDRFRGV